MEAPFFEKYGNEIDFQSASDLLEKISQIDCSVPGRTQGRKSYHRERYCLKIYLLQNKLLEFPLKIVKGESPDFMIFGPDRMKTALEHTDASTEDYQCAMTQLERAPAGTLLEMGTNRLVGPGEKLIGNGWTGNTVEKEWMDIILNSIQKKAGVLNQSQFKLADRYELLIYDNTHLSAMLHIEDALPLLANKTVFEKSQGACFAKKFHLISVIHSDQLRYDIFGNK